MLCNIKHLEYLIQDNPKILQTLLANQPLLFMQVLQDDEMYGIEGMKYSKMTLVSIKTFI